VGLSNWQEVKFNLYIRCNEFKMTTGKKIGLSILVIAIIAIAWLFHFVFTNPEYQPGEIIKTPSEAYLEIFPQAARQKITADYVMKPKQGNMLCRYLSNDKKYMIEEYVINSSTDQPLTEIISVEDKDCLKPHYMILDVIRGDLITTSFKSIFPIVSHLDVNLFGDSLKTLLRNDTTVSFYLRYRNFSIRCNGSDTSAMFSVAQPYYDENSPVTSSLPLDIIFIKRKKAIYVLWMSVNNSNTHLEPDMLYDLIKGK
jgi:hypothetical protein